MAHKTYSVKVTVQAQKQIQEVMHYITSELKNPDAALRLLDVMEHAVSSLSRLPQRISLTQEEPWHSSGVRKMPVNNFFIYFWIDEDNGKVQVTAVIYCKRDQIQQLSQMDMDQE